MIVIDNRTGEEKTAIYDTTKGKMFVDDTHYTDRQFSDRFMTFTRMNHSEWNEWYRDNDFRINGWEKDYSTGCVTVVFTDKTTQSFKVTPNDATL